MLAQRSPGRSWVIRPRPRGAVIENVFVWSGGYVARWDVGEVGWRGTGSGLVTNAIAKVQQRIRGNRVDIRLWNRVSE